ncbi:MULTISPECIES: DUF4262 domain-containing protein [unclassified Novosphingobium]|uniref:DUF4262 domain-containing protein n=1 Tax=unclassified Novosphingobium TaxID=2644732 RepID=UPI00086C7446|nr:MULTISPECIES: DUF4262 domain-containing protein [unclassified Novosphingobium]MBN9146517.1 DUF4262 domain-containing protein [Novosphingobium sp.]MDR6710292.1 hypothetical protein [Novosphingobium sp. 1748]ODU78111.1 MAG: hypothetical protein ABT10_23320 [Novosphingobium sp. SCN 63-17]OJX91031.1 MAG: hypothetical protein BGP00_07385 [Novosphingobium sp. 63-713]
MDTALLLSEEKLDDDERQFLNVIKDHGWFHTRVFDNKDEHPDFSYTTGFSVNHGYPEIILFSLAKDVSHSILWDVWRDIESGKRHEVGKKIQGIFGNADAVLLPVSKSVYKEYLGWNRWFYRSDTFDCLQLVWPDRDGKFPWEASFNDKFANSQPDLTGGGWNLHPV